MKKKVLPEVTIAVYGDGDWVINAKHTGFIQIKKDVIDELHTPVKGRTPQGTFAASEQGWPLTYTDAQGRTVTTIYRTRREYRDAKSSIDLLAAP